MDLYQIFITHNRPWSIREILLFFVIFTAAAGFSYRRYKQGRIVMSQVVSGLPVFRRSTMKVPTFSILPMHFRLLKYLKRLDFTGKFNVLTGHFFIENFFRYVV